MQTKHCPKCNTTKDVTEFFVHTKAKDGRYYQCKDCNSKDYISKNRSKYRRSNYVKNKEREGLKGNERKYRIHVLIYKYLQEHPCVNCGESDPIVLEFHHREGEEKLHNVSKLRCAEYSWDRIMLEINKCDILCANCHRRHTAKEQSWYKHVPESPTYIDSSTLLEAA